MNPVMVGDVKIFLSKMETSNQQKKSVRSQLNSTAPSVNWTELISIDYFTQLQQNTHPSQAQVEHSQGRHHFGP